MRFSVFSLLVTLLAAFAMAVEPSKSVIVTGKSDSVVEKAKAAILEAGGIITHEYEIIKGFSAVVPESILNAITAWSGEDKVEIEFDQVVSINNGGVKE